MPWGWLEGERSPKHAGKGILALTDAFILGVCEASAGRWEAAPGSASSCLKPCLRSW